MSKVNKSSDTSASRKFPAMYSKIDIWQARTARMLFILMCCAMPIFLVNGYYELPTQKWEFFIFSMVLTLLSVALVWVYRLTRRTKLLPMGKPDISDWAIIGFAAVTILVTLASPFRNDMSIWVGIPTNPGIAVGRYDGAITQLFFVAIFFIISRWYKPREKDFMWFSITAIAISIIGILQFFGLDFLGLWPNYGANVRKHFFDIHLRTTLGNTNTVSVFVTVAVLFTGFLYIRKKSKWQPLWFAASAFSFWMWDVANADSGTIGIAVAMLLCIPFIIQSSKTLGRTLILVSAWVATFTIQTALFGTNLLNLRQINDFAAAGGLHLRPLSSLLPFLAVFAVLLAVGLLLNFKGKELDPDAPPKWKLGVILIVVCILVGIVGVEFLGRPDADGHGSGVIFEAREIMHGNIQDNFGTYRIFIWRNALNAFPNNPIIGTGPDTFALAFPAEAQVAAGGDYQFFENAHNEYIQYLITHGIVGLLFYLAFVISIVVRSVKKAFNDPILMAVLAAFVGYLAQAFFNISHPIASQMFWVFAGILLSRRLSEDGKFEVL